MPLSPGDKLGPYEILSPLGAGSMGEVWKARDTRLNRIIAIKRLKSDHTARFQQEAHAIAALNHPHICQIYDVGPDYLVMEYVEGEPAQGPLRAEDAVKLAVQIASALEEAHGHGILHRDLKTRQHSGYTKGCCQAARFRPGQAHHRLRSGRHHHNRRRSRGNLGLHGARTSRGKA